MSFTTPRRPINRFWAVPQMLPLPTRSTRYEILYEGEDGELEDFDEDAEMEQNDNDEEDEDNLMPPIKKKSQDLTSYALRRTHLSRRTHHQSSRLTRNETIPHNNC